MANEVRKKNQIPRPPMRRIARILAGGAWDTGGVGEVTDADVLRAGVGAGGRVAVSKVLAEFRPEPPGDVPALVAVGD